MNHFSWQHFLTMGGYAAYVWSAYAIMLIIFITNIGCVMKAKQITWKQLQQYYQNNDESSS